MAIQQFYSPWDLEEWLKTKPEAWSNFVAMRAAMRAFPFVFEPKSYQEEQPSSKLILDVFRAILIGSCFAKPEQDHEHRAILEAGSNIDDILALDKSAAGFAAVGAADASDTAVVRRPAASAGSAAANSARAATQEDGRRSFDIWKQISLDCNSLATSAVPRSLMSAPLWADMPYWFFQSWSRARSWLQDHFGADSVVLLWFQDRIRGNPNSFSTFNDMAQVDFQNRLFPKDQTWWLREPESIYKEISAWVRELSNLEAPRQADLAQNKRAITFTATQDGKIDLAKKRDPDLLDTSEEAALRHKETRHETAVALQASDPSLAQANDLVRPLEAYQEALGETVDEIIPSLLIARGEKLRRLIALRDDPSSSAIPFSEAQSAALQDWQVAHNLLVGLDAYLSNIERVAAGPDTVPTIIELEAIKHVIDSVRENELPTDEAAEALEDSADNVPDNAPPDDRRLVQATETLKNFIRSIGELAKRNRKTIALGGAGSGYGGALWIQRNIEWLRDVFTNEPSILGILEWIAALPL